MTATQQRADTATRTASPLFSSLVGLAALAVLLQGLWAGLFIGHQGKSWVEVHGLGADLSILLAALATGFAIWKLRERRDLWVGSLAFTVLLVLEAWFGGLIADEHLDGLTVVHIPLAMALMGLAVWLPLQARRRP